MRDRNKVRPMEGAMLSAQMREIGIGARELSRMCGQRDAGRIARMIRENDVPSWMPLVIYLLKRPGAVEAARVFCKGFIQREEGERAQEREQAT